MYEAFYRLEREPFSLQPDPRFLHLSDARRAALEALHHGIQSGAGLICVLGDPGLGKTTLLRTVLEGRAGGAILPIFVFYPRLGFDDLLRLLRDELGLPLQARETTAALVRRIQKTLLALHSAGRRLVLFLDEAHLTPIETLESLRLLANLETPTQKLLQIVLVGQPALLTRLEQSNQGAILQRIALTVRLQPLSRSESRAYLAGRLSRAGGSIEAVFSPGAAQAIVAAAGGIPRRLNALSNLALAEGYVERRRPIDRRTVQRALGEAGVRRRGRTAPLAAAAAVLAVALAVGASLALRPPGPSALALRGDPGPVRTRLDGRERPFSLMAVGRGTTSVSETGSLPLPPSGRSGGLRPRIDAGLGIEGVGGEPELLKGDAINEGGDHPSVARP